MKRKQHLKLEGVARGKASKRQRGKARKITQSLGGSGRHKADQNFPLSHYMPGAAQLHREDVLMN